MSDARRTRIRRAVRVLPVDSDGAVLLLRCVNPAQQSAPFLITVGGGIEAGESECDAAVRELWEETGMLSAPENMMGPIHQESFSFVWESDLVTQHQNYYAMAVSDAAVVFDHLEEIAVASVVGHGWWTAAQLHECADLVLPEVQRAVDAATASLDRLRPS
jgi:8-oxo-dGTP pyrophosphatase MutT (NUDIX family)